MKGPEASYAVRVPIFEGPLDLLLHLVRVNAVDVTDIPIVEITRQYEEYLEWMRDLNLEVAAEFLVMAATLVHIKSRVLLPREPLPGEEEEEDPRRELTRMLLEHQQFREALAKLREREVAQAGVCYRSPDLLGEFEDEFHLEVGLFDLLSAFRTVLEERGSSEPQGEVPADPFPLREAVAWLLERVVPGRPVILASLFRELSTRYKMIAVFLGLLELIRVGSIRAAHGSNEEEILLHRREGPTRKGSPGAARGEIRPGEDTVG